MLPRQAENFVLAHPGFAGEVDRIRKALGVQAAFTIAISSSSGSTIGSRFSRILPVPACVRVGFSSVQPSSMAWSITLEIAVRSRRIVAVVAPADPPALHQLAQLRRV
jgi:hypothetical protein